MRLKFRQAGMKAMGGNVGIRWGRRKARRRRRPRARLCSPAHVTRALALAALLTLAAAPASAGETACWFENGVVVVPAEVMGVSGDFILDTATPHTQLAETQAQAAGFAETQLSGEVRLAGPTLAGRPVAVADLDMRTGALPT